MTGRPAFGEFLISARKHASACAGRRGAAGGEGDVQEVIDSLLRVVTVMSRYVQDAPVVPGEVRATVRPPLTAWGQASLDARDALTNAVGHLLQHSAGRRRPGVMARSELARHLDVVAVSLTAGRDLLHTHLGRNADGAREFRSEWGIVVCSPPVTRALLAELAPLARQIAAPCADLALYSDARDTADARRSLNGACQWLWVLAASAQAAQRSDPVSATDRELLHAIPVNTPPPRHVPEAVEPVASWYDAVISSAERVRHAAWVSSRRPAWSPRLTADSLRRVAATSTVTSHHCEILLRSLAARTAEADAAEIGPVLLRAADAAGRARAGWLSINQALNQVSTDTPRQLFSTASEASDLALCTGRLAYADPRWRLSSGAGHQPRQPLELAPDLADVPLAVAAVHHACDAVTGLAHAERERLHTAASASRILVPTRSLPDMMDIPRPFAPALPDRIDALLFFYEHTGRAAAEATVDVGDAAAAVQAPSRVLTAARAAADATRNGRSSRPEHAAGEPSVASGPPDLPGQVEGMLRELRITSPDLLRRAAEIDHASEQLIIDAAGKLRLQQSPPRPVTLSRTPRGAARINHAVASRDPRVATLPHRAASAQPELPEPEP